MGGRHLINVWCFSLFREELLYSLVAVIIIWIYEIWIWKIHCSGLNLICVSASHSPDWPSESLPFMCVELHELQVVLPAHPMRSSLPQRVCRYQYPQWLLTALKHPVTTQTLEYTHCAGFPAWERHSPKRMQDIIRGIRGEVEILSCVVNEHPDPSYSSLLSFYHVNRVCCWLGHFTDKSALFSMILNRFTLSLP